MHSGCWPINRGSPARRSILHRISQNQEVAKDRLAAEIDHQVNSKSEVEIGLLLRRVDELEAVTRHHAEEQKQILTRLADEKGAYLTDQLSTVPGVKSVRGQGLLLAVELADGRDAKVAYADLLAAGLVTNAVTATALRLAPPLTVTYAEMDEAVAMIRTALA